MGTAWRCLLSLVLLVGPIRSTRALPVPPDFRELDRQLAAGALGQIKSLLIARDGVLQFAGYYRGTNAQTLHLLNSVTKSVAATLIGVLERQQRIDRSEPVSALLTRYDWSDPRFAVHAALTVEQVLTQRHGLDWNELGVDYRDPGNVASAMFAAPDWYAYVLTRPLRAAAGTRFDYSTGASTLLGGFVRARTGLSPQAFLSASLLEPLGIHRFHFEVWHPQGMGHGLSTWPFDDAPLGNGLWLTAPDLLKFAELYRNGGVHQGRRLLDAEWIRAAWTAHSHAGNSAFFAGRPGAGYGYQWWLQSFYDQRGRRFAGAVADGWGRQYLIILPELGLTLVTTSDDYDDRGPGIGTALRTLILDQFDPLIDARFSGSWSTPAFHGQGVSIEVLEPAHEVLLYWFTYRPDGGKEWLMAQGPIDGEQAALTIHRTDGGRFLAPDPITVTAVGHGTLRFADCDSGVLDFVLDGATGGLPLRRLTGRCDSPLLPSVPSLPAAGAP